MKCVKRYDIIRTLYYEELLKEWVKNHTFILFIYFGKDAAMAKGIEAIAYEIGDPVAEALGVSIVDIEYKKEAGSWYLRIYIDKEGGVGLGECEQFSRAFGDEIDARDPIREPYCLEVSSPGVDRVLKKDREFLHYVGRHVEVKLYKAIHGIKEFDGILEGYRDGVVTVNAGGQIFEFDKKEAVFVRLYFVF